MRRLIPLVIAVAIALSLMPGCRPRQPKASMLDAEGAVVSATLPAAGPAADLQLLKGFHQLESGLWRWTMGQFAFALGTPEQSLSRGALLEIHYSLPESLSKVSQRHLKVTVNGIPVPERTTLEAGDQTIRIPIPSSSLGSTVSTIECELDHFVPAGTMEKRELGLIFFAARLSSQ